MTHCDFEMSSSLTPIFFIESISRFEIVSLSKVMFFALQPEVVTVKVRKAVSGIQETVPVPFTVMLFCG